jgi:hypothetical protein
MKKAFVIFLIMMGLSIANIAKADPPLSNHSEKLNYTVYYNWGVVWINGGTLTLKASPDSINGKTLRKIEGIGKSSSKWKWLFELEDHYTTWCNPDSFLPVKSVKKTMEGGYFIHNQYHFNYQDSMIYIRTEESKKSLAFDTIAINHKVFDAQSATTYLRFLDFNSRLVGDTLVLHILMDGELRKQKIIFKGKKNLKDKDNQAYSTYKFTAVVAEHNLFSSSDAINVWITDDDKRIPLYIEANLTVGSVKIFHNGIKLKAE